MRSLAPLFVAALALGLVATLAPCRHAHAQHRVGCDPVSFPQGASIPAGTDLACGDGQLRDYVSQCVATCGGGCGEPTTCGAPVCTHAHEVCDGANLGGATCRSLGFGGGALRCGSGCDAFDTSGCSPCTSGACGITTLGADVAPAGEVRLVANGAGGSGVLPPWSRGDGHVGWARVAPSGGPAQTP